MADRKRPKEPPGKKEGTGDSTMETNGAGSIVQLERGKPRGKCRKWQLRVSVGKNPRTGKYQTKTRRVAGTYTDALKELERFKAELGKRKYAGREKITFAECCERYLKMRAHGGSGVRKVRQSTLKKERWCFNSVARELGADTPMSDIGEGELEAMFAALANGEGAAGKPMGGAYLGGMHSMLHGLFAYALREGFVESDPMECVMAPSSDTKPRRALPIESYAALIGALDPTDRMQLAVMAMACCGLRRGEVQAHPSGDCRGGIVHVGKSKTASGLRDVPMPKVLERGIAARRACLNAELAPAGLFVTDAMPLLSDALGSGVSVHYLGVWWQKHRGGFGLDGWTLHELRHSFVTLLSESGASMSAMRELAGHKSASTTIGVYAHASREEKRDAVEAAIGLLDVH